MLVYLDDIVVYSNTLEEHVEHLRMIFRVLRENQLDVNMEKCFFTQEDVSFIGHWIWHDKNWIDKKKVLTIQDWGTLTKLTKLRSFLGLVNYYSRFIKGCSSRTAPLTGLLQNDQS